jgi:vitamin B12 transporter
LNRKANINLGVKYNGQQTDYAFDAAFNRSTVVLSDYTLVNIAASYEIFDHVEIFARVENMLNDSYQEVYSEINISLSIQDAKSIVKVCAGNMLGTAY